MAHAKQTAKIVRADIVAGIRHTLPRTWTKAAGILRARKSKLEKHVRTARKEWHE